ncbi:hypothetical protein ABZ078_43135 [Streptomyces sp. NPDC006385]|uniref:hypothetical protein n=1 Tax=Streptomyces sp. NPDC006385 TaxID=3156761 RepID=UPI0033BF79AE
MARRHDIERIFKELEEIQGALNDPTTGLGAFHQEQDQLRRKTLENVQQGTAALREENRELRRRQERMLGDLGDTRTAVEGLRREIAQAGHTRWSCLARQMRMAGRRSRSQSIRRSFWRPAPTATGRTGGRSKRCPK